MSKAVQDSKFTEWAGLDRISTTVHAMKCFWREITKDDYGVDGEIEIVLPKVEGKGYETLGNVLKVQAKSGKKYVVHDSEDSFASPVQKSDLETWNNSRYPVLYIIYHPTDDKLYAKEVRSYVKETTNVFQSPCRITFNKRSDLFDVDYFTKIKAHAEVSRSRLTFYEREELYTNLFPVRTLPALFHASTNYLDAKELRADSTNYLPPICVRGGRLFSFADMRVSECPLRAFCDTDVEELSARDWLREDPDRHGDYVYMLNQLLGKIQYQLGLKYNADYGRTYFPRLNNTSLEFKLPWFNIRSYRQSQPRITVKFYRYGIETFWRHLACNLSFQRYRDSWFLRIIPKYFFTINGSTPCERDLAGPYTTKLKAMEHNMQVLNHVLFWADYLSNRQEYISYKMGRTMILNIDKKPLTGISAFAIPDDPAVYEEKTPSPQMNLFGDHPGGSDD